MLSGIRKEPEKRVRLTLKAYHSAHKKCLMTMLIRVLVKLSANRRVFNPEPNGLVNNIMIFYVF